MKINEIILEEVLNELKMSPGRLAQEVSRLGITPVLGVEIEFCIPPLGDDSQGGRGSEFAINDDDTIDDVLGNFVEDSDPKDLKKVLQTYKEWVAELKELNNPSYDDDEEEEEDEWDNDEEEDDWQYSVVEFMKDQHNIEYPTVIDFADIFHLDLPESIKTAMASFPDTEYAIKNHLEEKNIRVQLSKKYHGPKRSDNWILEPDSSIEPDDKEDMGAELISPPMPYEEGIVLIKNSLDTLLDLGAYTNDSCGFHINVSFKGSDITKLDVVKLALFLGESHILSTFDRMFNEYAHSVIIELENRIKKNQEISTEFVNTLDAMLAKMNQTCFKNLSQELLELKYYAIHLHKDYIEFRAAGGMDYIESWDELSSTINRCIFAMSIALNPDAYRKEYIKKLYKFIHGIPKVNKNVVDLFLLYSTGGISKKGLIQSLHYIRDERMKNRVPDGSTNQYEQGNNT